MIRLIVQAQTSQEAVLQVDGWISGTNVSILEQEGTRLLSESHRLVLDLRGVHFIDEEGIALLRGWSGPALTLRGGSLFIRGLLEDHGLTRGGTAH